MLNEARGGGFVPSCSAKFEVTLHMITVHIRSGAPKRGAGSWDDSGGVILVQQSECVISLFRLRCHYTICCYIHTGTRDARLPILILRKLLDRKACDNYSCG